MPLREKLLNVGKLTGVIYNFDDAGDELPLHVHGEHDIHITVVARGSFRCFGHGWERVLSTGEVLDWDVGQHHGFIALEPNSRLVNIHK